VKLLIDTNVISEIRKGPRCDSKVASWYEAIADNDLYLSALVLGEVRKGIEQTRVRDRVRAETLEGWLSAVSAAFGERILPIDGAVAEEWGRMNARRDLPTVDSLMAATAKVHGLTFVTRNDSDVRNTGATVLNPFKSAPLR
jgi:predicted nucleic acid-binding protein